MIQIEAESLSKLAAKALEECKKGVVHNLVLSGDFSYNESESHFVMTHDGIASKWQDPRKPNELLINHGQYIHKYGDGLLFLVRELKKKKDSNRACISLIGMEDIINSHDDPIPSFMILQFGFAGDDPKTILTAAYFRALEVSCFLPINLAEISQVIRTLKIHFPEIERFQLILHAFRAYAKQNFYCLRKASIDSAEPILIAYAVKEKNFAKLKDWLDSKITIEESIICTDGLHHLRQAIDIQKTDYNHEILIHLDNVLNNMQRLRLTRQSTSHGKAIKELEKNIKKELLRVKELLI